MRWRPQTPLVRACGCILASTTPTPSCTVRKGPESNARDAAPPTKPQLTGRMPSLADYRVFVNPSTSEVLCTATAEALAMGKKVVIPDHPSNRFFAQFTNAVLYEGSDGLVPALTEALRTPPAPMAAKERHLLSWEAATERLLDAARLPEAAPSPADNPLTSLAYLAHNAMGYGPASPYFRENSGATPNSALPGDGLGLGGASEERPREVTRGVVVPTGGVGARAAKAPTAARAA